MRSGSTHAQTLNACVDPVRIPVWAYIHTGMRSVSTHVRGRLQTSSTEPSSARITQTQSISTTKATHNSGRSGGWECGIGIVGKACHQTFSKGDGQVARGHLRLVSSRKEAPGTKFPDDGKQTTLDGASYSSGSMSQG